MPDDGRSRLGRGLAALMGDLGAEATIVERARGQRRVSIEFLRPNPRNPRRNFSDDELDELARSIKERGVIQPVVVRPVRGSKDSFEIIAGERRWRAAQRAGLHDIPIVPLEATDSEALELAIIENVQRSDLNPLEEAAGYQALASEYAHSHDAIARIVGKSRSHVTNTLRLLKLPEPVKETGKPSNKRHIKNSDTVALERRVSNALGLAVTIDHRGTGGVLQVHYRSLDQLDEVLRRLERN
jgi:ParB family transcriptional regulator, chromosome partitioning protein